MIKSYFVDKISYIMFIVNWQVGAIYSFFCTTITLGKLIFIPNYVTFLPDRNEQSKHSDIRNARVAEQHSCLWLVGMQ